MKKGKVDIYFLIDTYDNTLVQTNSGAIAWSSAEQAGLIPDWSRRCVEIIGQPLWHIAGLDGFGLLWALVIGWEYFHLA